MSLGRWLIVAMVMLVLLAQLTLWSGTGSVAEWLGLRASIAEQETENQRASDRNAKIAGQIQGLRESNDALDERARRELGLIRDGETYFQITEPARDPQRQ